MFDKRSVSIEPEGGYDEGIIVEILGFEVYNSVDK